jgi:hypothetical protein
MTRACPRYFALVTLLLTLQMFLVAPYLSGGSQSAGDSHSLSGQLHPLCVTSLNPTSFEGKPEKTDRKNPHQRGGLPTLCQRAWNWPPVAAAHCRRTAVLCQARPPALWLLKQALLI